MIHPLFRACRKVNFEDPNVNVGLPIFTIHGNHDDPVGADGLSAVDLLSTARLVNYFGKVVRRCCSCSCSYAPVTFTYTCAHAGEVDELQ